MKEVRRQTASCSSPLMNDADELRQMLMKKNEKIEFLKDHIDHLLEELHRKSRYVTYAVFIIIVCVNVLRVCLMVRALNCVVKQSRVQPATSCHSLLCNSCDLVVHTHVHLPPGSRIWYCPV